MRSIALSFLAFSSVVLARTSQDSLSLKTTTTTTTTTSVTSREIPTWARQKKFYHDDHAQHNRITTEVSTQCETKSDELSDEIAIAHAEIDIQTWVDSKSFDSICETNPSNEYRMICNLDYNWGHDLREACDSFGNLYIETNYTLRCLENEDVRPGPKRMEMLFNTHQFPACVSSTCSLDEAISMEEANVENVMVALGGDTSVCNRLRFEVADVAAEELAAIESALMPSSSPTLSAQPTEMSECLATSLTLQDEAPAISVELESIENQMAEYSKNNPQDQAFCDLSDIVSYSTSCHNQQQYELVDECSDVTNVFCEIDISIVEQNSLDQSCTDTYFMLGIGNSSSTTICLIDFSLASEHNLLDSCSPKDVTSTECETVNKPIVDVFQNCTNDISVFCEIDVTIVEENGLETSCTETYVKLGEDDSAASMTICVLGFEFTSSHGLIDDCTPKEVNNSNCETWTVNRTIEVCEDTTSISFAWQISPSVDCIMDYSSIEHNLFDVCEEAGGTYFENSFEIECEGIEAEVDDGSSEQQQQRRRSSSLKSKIEFENHPSCRESSCTVEQATQVAKWDAEKIRAELEPLVENRVCQVSGVKSEKTEKEPTVSKICETQSSQVNSIIEVINAKTSVGIQYGQLGMDYYCSREEYQIRDCNLDFSRFESVIETKCIANGGQYVEGNFYITCKKDDKELHSVFRNMESCIGTVCDPNDALLYFPREATWIVTDYESTYGWDCEFSISGVKTPYYEEEEPNLGSDNGPRDVVTTPVSAPVSSPSDGSMYFGSTFGATSTEGSQEQSSTSDAIPTKVLTAIFSSSLLFFTSVLA